MSPLIALLLGALSAFGFQPVGLWILMPLALAGLCELIWRSKSLKQALGLGGAFGLGQFVVGLNWIATAFTYQAKMPPALGWVAVMLLSLYLAVYPALAAGLAWRFKGERRLALVLVLAGSWAVTEWLRGTMFTGFPWNPLAAADADTLTSIVPMIGTYGATAFVVFLGGALWMLKDWEIRPLIFWTLFGVGLSLAAEFTTAPRDKQPLYRDIRIVQPNIGQEVKWRPGFSEEAARRLAILSMKPGGSRPRLLFWPEAAITNPLEDARIAEEPYAQFERQRAAALVEPDEYLLTGGLAIFSPDGRRIGGAANSVYVLGQGGRVIGRYDKAHLVPYGEYLPMRPVLSAIGLSRLAPGDFDFNDGPGPRTLEIPGWGKAGLQLCYEIIFSGEVVDRRNRPDFIFNPSNDAWFGRWGPPQHLAQARLRAAEEGIPVIRSTPTGISAVIDADGRVLNSLPWQTAGVIDTYLPHASAPTVFARFGNLIPLLLGFALIIGGIAIGRTRR